MSLTGCALIRTVVALRDEEGDTLGDGHLGFAVFRERFPLRQSAFRRSRSYRR